MSAEGACSFGSLLLSKHAKGRSRSVEPERLFREEKSLGLGRRESQREEMFKRRTGFPLRGHAGLGSGRIAFFQGAVFVGARPFGGPGRIFWGDGPETSTLSALGRFAPSADGVLQRIRRTTQDSSLRVAGEGPKRSVMALPTGVRNRPHMRCSAQQSAPQQCTL
jgi:hypothetical protein